MKKMMNRKNICMECGACGAEEKSITPVDNALKTIEKSEHLIRNMLVDLLDASRLLFEEAIQEAELEEEVSLMVLLDKDGDYSIVTEEEAEEEYLDKKFSEVAVIYDGQLIATFDPDDVVTLGGTDYLVGPMLVREIDENGNEAKINKDTIANAVDYASCCEVEIRVEDQSYQAFVLV